MSVKKVLLVAVCLVLVLSSDAAGKLKKKTNKRKSLNDKVDKTRLRLDAMDLDESATFCADPTSSKLETVLALATCVSSNAAQFSNIGVAGFFKNTGSCLGTVFDTFMACLTENVRNELKTIVELVFTVASTQTESLKASIPAVECSVARINEYMSCIKKETKIDTTSTTSDTIYTKEFCRKQIKDPCDPVIPKQCQEDPQMAKLDRAITDMLDQKTKEQCKPHLSNSASRFQTSLFTAVTFITINRLLSYVL